MSFSILLVDDESGLRSLLQEALATVNYTVYEAEDGLAALSQFNLLQPDLVLLDITMPRLDGIAVLRELRHNNQKVGILMMSALRSRQMKEEVIANGADGYLAKPFLLQQLFAEIQRVRDLMQSRSAHCTCA